VEITIGWTCSSDGNITNAYIIYT